MTHPCFSPISARTKAGRAKKPRLTARARVLARVEAFAGAINAPLLALDLKLKPATVDRAVAALLDEGLIEYGWDGRALTTTDAHARTLADAALRPGLK